MNVQMTHIKELTFSILLCYHCDVTVILSNSLVLIVLIVLISTLLLISGHSLGCWVEGAGEGAGGRGEGFTLYRNNFLDIMGMENRGRVWLLSGVSFTFSWQVDRYRRG